MPIGKRFGLVYARAWMASNQQAPGQDEAVAKAPEAPARGPTRCRPLWFSEIRSTTGPASPSGFSILHTQPGAVLTRAVFAKDPTSAVETLWSLKTSLGIRGATSEKRPLDESGVGGFVTVTPLHMPAWLRRPDVRTDDAARQLAAPLPLAHTLAAPPAASPACPSPATNEFACRDNTPGITSNADAMTLR
jgi:hypothetical protein